MDITNEIASRLQDIETEFDVRVLYACESGSRAWGFASSDSDWDVRFIYVHKLDWYFSVEAQRDVIELPIVDDLDINSWELRKALRLMKKGNPVLLEWLNSPIRYRTDQTFLAAMRELAVEYYAPASSFHHYLHMAHRNWREYLKGPEVWLKKYLYVLRPALACRWIELELGAVPMEFMRLVETLVVSADLRAAIDRLLVQKSSGGELGLGPAIPEINVFLAAEMPRLAGIAHTLSKPQAPSDSRLIALLQKIVMDGRTI